MAKAKSKNRKWKFVERVFMIIAIISLGTVIVRAMDSKFTSSGNEANNTGRCDQDAVFVPVGSIGVCIDKYEASAGGNCPYPDPSSQNASLANLNSSGCYPVSGPGRLPWRYISQDQAERACALAGKRLATNAEWYSAALGTPDKSGAWDTADCQVENNWSAHPGPTGSGKNCVSGTGAYDMVGNVWEWVAGTVTDGSFEDRHLPAAGYVAGTDGYSLPGTTTPENSDPDYNDDYFWIKPNAIRAIARGGYWDNGTDAGQYAVYMVVPPDQAAAGIGFRCANLPRY